MNLGFRALAISAFIASCQQPAPATELEVSNTIPELASASAFLSQVYQQRFGSDGSATALNDDRIFDQSTLALIEEERRRTPAGEIGVLEADPLCNCQDFENLQVNFQVEGKDADAAHVEAQIENGSGSLRTNTLLTLDLVREANEWRIHDITPEQGPGLRATLLAVVAEGA